MQCKSLFILYLSVKYGCKLRILVDLCHFHCVYLSRKTPSVTYFFVVVLGSRIPFFFKRIAVIHYALSSFQHCFDKFRSSLSKTLCETLANPVSPWVHVTTELSHSSSLSRRSILDYDQLMRTWSVWQRFALICVLTSLHFVEGSVVVTIHTSLSRQ